MNISANDQATLTALFDGVDHAATVSRVRAKAEGRKFYFTGQPCSAGHTAQRHVANFTCTVCQREAQARKRAERPEHFRAIQKRHRERAGGGWAARTKKWRDDNPNKDRASGVNSRCAAQGVPGTITAEELDEIEHRQGGRCAMCGTDQGLSVDHVLPKSRGGLNVASNIQLLCGTCNRSKGAKLIASTKLICQEIT